MAAQVRHVLFTSESVGAGHPDKICDQVSDAILDACFKGDPNSKVACETATKTEMIMVFGEITSDAKPDIEKVVRDTIKRIGYDNSEMGFDYKTCKVLIEIEPQSPDIFQGVHKDKAPEDIGAGDQGFMYGYATDETDECMPLSIVLAHKLNMRLVECREKNILPWIRPDSKSQVTVEYKIEAGVCTPIRVHTIVISVQHADDKLPNGVPLEEQRKALREHVVNVVIPAKYLDDKVKYHLQPSERFVIGGPPGDAGLTGRKIIVDTYGGWGGHGGGAFSGKDPSKVDRSGAYAARWVAKSLVKAGLCRRVLIQVSYAIAVAEPLAIFVDTYGTGTRPDSEIEEIVRKNFDLRPGVIIRDLNLRRPIYEKTACFGHFGRSEPEFTWEKPKDLIIP